MVLIEYIVFFFFEDYFGTTIVHEMIKFTKTNEQCSCCIHKLELYLFIYFNLGMYCGNTMFLSCLMSYCGSIPRDFICMPKCI